MVPARQDCMAGTNKSAKMNQSREKNTTSFNMLIYSFKKLFFLSLIAGMPLLGMSQDPNGVPDPGNGGSNPDAGSVPIDGGLSLLMAAGVGYGVKKIRAQRKKNKEEAED